MKKKSQKDKEQKIMNKVNKKEEYRKECNEEVERNETNQRIIRKVRNAGANEHDNRVRKKFYDKNRRASSLRAEKKNEDWREHDSGVLQRICDSKEIKKFRKR